MCHDSESWMTQYREKLTRDSIKKIYVCIVRWSFLKTNVILGGVYMPALRNVTGDRGLSKK